jgi:hypothetical protein
MYGRRKLWLRHRGRRLCGLCTGEPAVGRPVGLHCWRRAAGPGAGDPYTGGVHQTVSVRLRLELPHDQAAAAVGAADPLAEWQDPWRFVIINGQAWTRGHRVDYDGWAALGVPGRGHRAAPPPPRRTQRAGRSAPSPVPSTRAAAQGRGRVLASRQAATQPDLPPGAYSQRILLDGCRATGVEYRDGAGPNPASDRLPRGDTQRRPLS